MEMKGKHGLEKKRERAREIQEPASNWPIHFEKRTSFPLFVRSYS